MNKNLESYVKVYDNWLDKDICKKTITELETPVITDTFQQHNFYHAATKTFDFRHDRVRRKASRRHRYRF